MNQLRLHICIFLLLVVPQLLLAEEEGSIDSVVDPNPSPDSASPGALSGHTPIDTAADSQLQHAEAYTAPEVDDDPDAEEAQPIANEEASKDTKDQLLLDDDHEEEEEKPRPHSAAPPGSDEEESSKRNRHFPRCRCLQRFRTRYLTGNICGKAALCYWEIWNYKSLKEAAKGADVLKEYRKNEGRCDRYMIEKHTCLIGYPQPRIHPPACQEGLDKCEKILARMLYEDCEPLRKFYGLAKPQDVQHQIQTHSLNYDLKQDKDNLFRARPNSEHPKWNGYYTISCPLIYRFPYFTIDFLLKDLDPSIEYSETSSLKGVAELIPRFARVGMNNERILNFDALSLDEEDIHWCGISRNYVCVRTELDRDGNLCDERRLSKFRNKCEPGEDNPRGEKKDDTAFALAATTARMRLKMGIGKGNETIR